MVAANKIVIISQPVQGAERSVDRRNCTDLHVTYSLNVAAFQAVILTQRALLPGSDLSDSEF